MEGDLSFRVSRESQEFIEIPLNPPTLLSDPKVYREMLTFLERGCDQKVTPEAMKLYVNNGEKIAHQLAEGKSHAQIGVTKSNARDLIWYMFAMTARYDELFAKGVIRMDDSDKKLYQFLASCSDYNGGTYDRVSSHYSHAMELGKMQKGLDMGDLQMPGNFRHILFSDLKDGTTFIKLEPYGLPPFWSKGFRTFANFKEFVNHSLQYVSTRFIKKSQNYTARREHLTSEQKKKFSNIMNRFKELAPTSSQRKQVKFLEKEGLKHGISKMEENLTKVNRVIYDRDVTVLTSKQMSKFRTLNRFLFAFQDDLKEIKEQDLKKNYTKGRKGSEVTLPTFAEFFRQLDQMHPRV